MDRLALDLAAGTRARVSPQVAPGERSEPCSVAPDPRTGTVRCKDRAPTASATAAACASPGVRARPPVDLRALRPTACCPTSNDPVSPPGARRAVSARRGEARSGDGIPATAPPAARNARPAGNAAESD